MIGLQPAFTNNVLIPFSNRFGGDTVFVPPKTADLMQSVSEDSFEEARQRISELRDFYRSKGWHIAEFCLDYLIQHKMNGHDHKRKDKVTENILHELRPLFWAKSFLEAGVLPDKVFYEIVNDQRQDIPEAHQSIEHLFCAIMLHDLDEDFANVSKQHFLEYMQKRIRGTRGIHSAYGCQPGDGFLEEFINFNAQSMEALTFGRKTKKGKEKTHDGDVNVYYDGLENIWTGIAAKIADRLEGITTRYSPYAIPEFFDLKSDEKYRAETQNLFETRNVAWVAKKRFPQIASYLEIMDAKLNVAYRCFSSMVYNHPKNAKSDPTKARVRLEQFLPTAMTGGYLFDEKNRPLFTMLQGFEQEVWQHPSLYPIVKQMRDQMSLAGIPLPPAPGYPAFITNPRPENSLRASAG